MFEGPPPEPGQLCEGEDSEWNVFVCAGLHVRVVCVYEVGLVKKEKMYVSARFNDFCVPNCKRTKKGMQL